MPPEVCTSAVYNGAAVDMFSLGAPSPSVSPVCPPPPPPPPPPREVCLPPITYHSPACVMEQPAGVTTVEICLCESPLRTCADPPGLYTPDGGGGQRVEDPHIETAAVGPVGGAICC